MKNVHEIEVKIEKIKNSDFKVSEFNYHDKNHKVSNLLRSTLICINAIDSIDDISKKKKKKLYEELDEIMKNKLKKLNPNFNKKILKNMMNGCHRGYIIYPMDILVVDDAIFHKEGVFDDYGNICKIRTFMFEGMKPYYSVSSLDFTDIDFLNFQNEGVVTKEDEIYTSKFICDNINSIYKGNITKPIYEFNNHKDFYGYSGVSYNVSGVNVYIDVKFYDIVRSLKLKNECDIKICIQSGDNIILYYVHQFFKNNEPIWSVIKANSDVWKLTDEVLKLENKSTNALYD